MMIAVIDGKGGGIGCQIVERLKSLHSNDIEIIALGTNSQATSNTLSNCNIDIIGMNNYQLETLFNDLTETVRKYIKEKQ